MAKDHGRVGLMMCWHIGYNAVLPLLLGFLGAFSRQPPDRVGIVSWPRGDDDLTRIREGLLAKPRRRTRVRARTDAPNKTKVVWRDWRAKPIKNERIWGARSGGDAWVRERLRTEMITRA